MSFKIKSLRNNEFYFLGLIVPFLHVFTCVTLSFDLDVYLTMTINTFRCLAYSVQSAAKQYHTYVYIDLDLEDGGYSYLRLSINCEL